MTTGAAQTLKRWLGRGAGVLLDQLYPPVCVHCDAPMAGPDSLCASCFRQLRPIAGPICPVLGLPFAAALGPGAVSAEALADPPPFRRARAAVAYNALAGALVGRLKYGDRPELAAFCARLMAGAGGELFAEAPVLVPVPLHPHRLRQRRFNQSVELARFLARHTGLVLRPDLLRRAKPTRRQVGLSGEGRARNVQGAFAAHADFLARSGGRRILLIDDVYTTGATVKAATRALLRAGAPQVDVLCFARVVVGADDPIYQV